MKVLIEVDNTDCRIGAVNDVLDLCRYGKRQGVEFYLAGPSGIDLHQKALQAGFRIVRKKSRSFSRSGLLLYALDVVNWMIILKRLRPDVVHLNYQSWGPSLACAARMAGIPVVGRAGGIYTEKNPSCRWVSAYFANCEAQAAKLLESPLRERVAVVGDLINLERFNELQLKGALPDRREGVPRLLFLGQLVERKGLETLVRAFSAMRCKAEMYMVGGDWGEQGYPARIRELVAELRCEESVHLLNHRSDAIALLKECDIFVLPSLSEARPRSIIEALLLGKCVVSTRTGGIPTLIEDGATALLVEPGRVDALALALESVVSDRELRERLGEAAKSVAEATFNPVVTACNYIRAYRGCLESSAPVAAT